VSSAHDWHPSRRIAGVAAVAVLLSSAGAAGCSLDKGFKRAGRDIASNRAVISQFTESIKTGGTTPFAVTYRTTGQDPATIRYAVRPPADVAFRERTSGNGAGGSGGVDLIANSAGEYSCSPPAAGGRWRCRKLGQASALVRNQILDLYTPAHWVAFLKGFSVAAGFAGDKVRASRLTVNGFRLRCVGFRAFGVGGTSRICTTAQGILGYVKVASSATSFEITSYTAAPAAALFRLPPGARIITRATARS
jgi:hypothetical protein